jgi:hypothetical protein
MEGKAKWKRTNITLQAEHDDKEIRFWKIKRAKVMRPASSWRLQPASILRTERNVKEDKNSLLIIRRG